MRKTLEEIVSGQMKFTQLKLNKTTMGPTIKRIFLGEKSSNQIRKAMERELEKGRKFIQKRTEIQITPTVYISIADIIYREPLAKEPWTEIELWIRKKRN
ncbi:hypothetical protein U8V72_27400 [Priestia filamentosa]|uniref:hypothetical protein n=1 Tax=Priestia filamentosa TaxID=1402861 RepID=UPI00397E24BF